MELSLNLVYNKKLKKLGVTGTYPSNDNCYRVEVIDVQTSSVDFVAEYLPKPVFDMWEVLHKVKHLIEEDEMYKIIETFNKYGEWKYYESSIDASMNTEDI